MFFARGDISLKYIEKCSKILTSFKKGGLCLNVKEMSTGALAYLGDSVLELVWRGSLAYSFRICNGSMPFLWPL